MKFTKFIKEKRIYLILLVFFIITSQILLLAYDLFWFTRVYIAVIPACCVIVGIVTEYLYKKKFYNNLLSKTNLLQEKYLVNEIISAPNFLEGQITKDVLDSVGKSMAENVDKYKYTTEDYKEYIELWIHEIKLPIAASKLVIENNRAKATNSIEEELDKIEGYVEQALFYARSNTVEQDYAISKTDLHKLINNVILKNKKELISNNIYVDLHDVENEVYTDSKWTEYIISQVIQNSIKYMKPENRRLEIWSKEYAENIVLYIKDNGIGIKIGEVSRVFDKGFTGTNGRISGKKSTGIGLYLCKKLCAKLGLDIDIESVENEKTIVKIIFPKGSYMVR